MAEKGKISPSEAWNRLRKARRMVHHARAHNITVEEIATSEDARRAVLAYSGYLEKGAGASLETWKMVVALMAEQDDEGNDRYDPLPDHHFEWEPSDYCNDDSKTLAVADWCVTDDPAEYTITNGKLDQA